MPFEPSTTTESSFFSTRVAILVPTTHGTFPDYDMKMVISWILQIITEKYV
ncbi:MAG: hypothetical protein ABH879_04165 [archaeon]